MKLSSHALHARRQFLKRLMVFCGLIFFGSAFREKLQARVASTFAPKSKDTSKAFMAGHDPFIGEICLFGFNFAPRNWATCDGQTMSIASNSALFSILGTYYGGNGTTTFMLPDLRGRIPLQQGQGPGLTPRGLGDIDGVETVTLSIAQIPAHSHVLSGTFKQVRTRSSTAPVGTGAITGGDRGNTSSALSQVGSGQAHNNMSPFVTINMCIATAGVFPSRP
jgi:microcystin-dependent protein